MKCIALPIHTERINRQIERDVVDCPELGHAVGLESCERCHNLRIIDWPNVKCEYKQTEL